MADKSRSDGQTKPRSFYGSFNRVVRADQPAVKKAPFNTQTAGLNLEERAAELDFEFHSFLICPLSLSLSSVWPSVVSTKLAWINTLKRASVGPVLAPLEVDDKAR